MLDEELIKKKSMDWIKLFVIKYNICPFAKHVVDKQSLKLIVINKSKLKLALSSVLSEIEQLDQHPEVETSLLIYPENFYSFFDYLDFLHLAEELLLKSNCEGIYQLASFHPDYCFDGVDENHVTNYTNRSPYPMLHILRETSIDTAIKFYGDTTKIPANNKATMLKIGLKGITTLVRRLNAS